MEPVLSIRSRFEEATRDAGEDSAEEPPGRTLEETLVRLRTAIWKRRPILGEIMQKHGGKVLHEYATDFLDVNRIPLLDGRKEELIRETQAMVAELLDGRTAEEVGVQLRKVPLVSTADHHAPIDHPFWVNANLISAIPYEEMNDPDLKYLVVFSFATVSLNNASGYPRGITFHGGMDGSQNLLRLPLLPDKLKTGVVYRTRAYTEEDLQRADAELAKKEKEGLLALGRGDAVRGVLRTYFGTPDVLASPDFASQITKINFRLWPKLFHADPLDPLPVEDARLPDLLYLEIETLVTRLLRKHHLRDTSSLVHRVLFAPDMRALALKHFDGIPGAFSRERDAGTFFFWGLDDKHRRVRLLYGDGFLRSPDGTVDILLSPESIARALEEGRLFPSMLLCYLMVSLYYGMKCLGGFCQVNDLTLTKEAWQGILREAQEKEEAEALVSVQTKELGGDGMVLAYKRTSTGDLIPATGIDMVLGKHETSFGKYIRRSKTVTLSEMMAPMLPEIYSVLYSFSERDPELCGIIPEEIVQGTGLQDKLLHEKSVRR